MRDIKWTDTERHIARRAYDAALESALARIMSTFKAKAAAASQPSDMWAVEDYLGRSRRQVDETFDYRYSQLLLVFARLIQERHLEEAQLAGLSEEKLATIRSMLSRGR
ncbi:hypothetical protein [Methylopila sp. M107]|uniref:hypothetical protein n=1 Tax=Methylopila sp. M107 TaxID=1101190 RepID=UPI0003727DCA|nr:hypothetical protein [Methylopila sp. M107]